MSVIEPDPELIERIVQVFAPPSAEPAPPHVQRLLEEISALGLDFVLALVTLTPDSAELGRALDAIDDAVSYAHRAVLRYPPEPVAPPAPEPARDSLGRVRRSARPVVETARVDEQTAQAMRDGKSPVLPDP